MSVQISRRTEARETPLRDFLLAATLPLLLMGLLGYFLGLAGRSDTHVDTGDLARMETRALAAEEQLAERTRFVAAIDSLLQTQVTAKEARQDEFARLIAQGQPDLDFGGDPLANWSRDVRRDHDGLARAISELQGSITGREFIREEDVHPVIELFEALNLETRQHFIDQRTAYSLQTVDTRELARTLNEDIATLETEVADLTADAKTAARKLENRDITIANLRASAGGDGGGVAGGAAATPVSYRPEANAIKDAAVEIEAISKRIPSGVLVSRKKKTEIETEILRQVAAIERALEVIE